jgi:tetratricopeptide (TPR) repeat protein
MDLNAELQNFKAINLEDIAHGGEQVPDNIRNSIFLYNKAIESLKTGSEDIAVIELKKATSMNPRFYEAMNLLGICYSYLGENDKAAEMFDKVMKAESNSILAVNFIQRLGLSDSVQSQKSRPVKKPAEQPGEPLKRVRTVKETAPMFRVKKQTLINAAKIGAGFIAGVLLAAVIFFSLPDKEADPVEPPLTDTSTVVNNDKALYEAKLAEWQDKYDLLQKDKDGAVQQADYYKAVIKLYDIDALVTARKYENAADMLLLMKTIEFKDAGKAKFDGLYATVMPQAARASYDQGYKLYNSRKYQDSLKKLEKVQVYYPQFYRMDAALYYMGRCCQALQDSRSAVALFQKLMNEYPASTYARSAKVRINELTKIP